MQPAMHIGIFMRIALHHRVKDGFWLLRGSGVVEIDQRLIINLAGEDWKVLADFGDVKHGRSDAGSATCGRI